MEASRATEASDVAHSAVGEASNPWYASINSARGATDAEPTARAGELDQRQLRKSMLRHVRQFGLEQIKIAGVVSSILARVDCRPAYSSRSFVRKRCFAVRPTARHEIASMPPPTSPPRIGTTLVRLTTPVVPALVSSRVPTSLLISISVFPGTREIAACAIFLLPVIPARLSTSLPESPMMLSITNVLTRSSSREWP